MFGFAIRPPTINIWRGFPARNFSKQVNSNIGKGRVGEPRKLPVCFVLLCIRKVDAEFNSDVKNIPPSRPCCIAVAPGLTMITEGKTLLAIHLLKPSKQSGPEKSRSS